MVHGGQTLLRECPLFRHALCLYSIWQLQATPYEMIQPPRFSSCSCNRPSSWLPMHIKLAEPHRSDCLPRSAHSPRTTWSSDRKLSDSSKPPRALQYTSLWLLASQCATRPIVVPQETWPASYSSTTTTPACSKRRGSLIEAQMHRMSWQGSSV
jgi:hypothetical protein